jgi:hypothetical protein
MFGLKNKGKYNDENKLIGQNAIGISVGEVEDMIKPF